MWPLHPAKRLCGSPTGEQLRNVGQTIRTLGMDSWSFLGGHHGVSGTARRRGFLKLSKLGNSQPSQRVPRSASPVFPSFSTREIKTIRRPQPWTTPSAGPGFHHLPSPAGALSPHACISGSLQGHTQPRHSGVAVPQQGPSKQDAGPRSLQPWTLCPAATLHTHRAGEALGQGGQTTQLEAR